MSTPTSPAVRLLESAVLTGTVPGGIIAHGHDPEPVARGAIAVDGPPLEADAIMRIQSMTKVIQAVAALRLVEQGVLALDDPVGRWLPELAAPRVLTSPGAPLDDTVPADTPITLRHLLTCTSGVGMILDESPLQRAMAERGLEAGSAPWTLPASDWLAALGTLPLVGQPGRVWRYHHSFSVLGILLSRVTGMSLQAHLRETLFTPLGMVDTGLWVPEEKRDRLPAAYSVAGEDEEPGTGRRPADGLAGLVELEPLGGGPLVGDPGHNVSHGELVSTAADYLRFLRALRDGELVSPAHLRLLSTDQVPAAAKQPDSFFPGFWNGTGWGFGVSVVTAGAHAGRWGWSGGAGTDFFVDPDGTLGLLLTQVGMGERIFELLGAMQELPGPTA